MEQHTTNASTTRRRELRHVKRQYQFPSTAAGTLLHNARRPLPATTHNIILHSSRRQFCPWQHLPESTTTRRHAKQLLSSPQRPLDRSRRHVLPATFRSARSVANADDTGVGLGGGSRWSRRVWLRFDTRWWVGIDDGNGRLGWVWGWGYEYGWHGFYGDERGRWAGEWGWSGWPVGVRWLGVVM